MVWSKSPEATEIPKLFWGDVIFHPIVGINVMILSWFVLKYLQYVYFVITGIIDWLCRFMLCFISLKGHKIKVFLGHFICFCFLSFCVLHIFVHVKILRVKKVKVDTSWSSSLPQKTPLLKRIISSLAFNSCDFVTSHCVTRSHMAHSAH